MYDSPIKSSSMATTKISDLRMEPATNGVMIRYCKKIEKTTGKGTYDNCSYDYPNEVFEKGDDESYDEMLDRATSRFKELWKESYQK